MIVVNSTPAAAENTTEVKCPIYDMFCKEIDAYCAYKDWLSEIEDELLETAVEEIMFDEYLHAKFLRDYMIDKDMYPQDDENTHEKKYWKIHKKFVHS